MENEQNTFVCHRLPRSSASLFLVADEVLIEQIKETLLSSFLLA
jgi:hypothetical protein